MSIPKEPRQLMINLMYLVLTALLALNVSAEVMNAFFTLDDGNKSTMATVDTQLDEKVKGVKELLSDESKAKYRPIEPAIDEVRTIVKEFNEYVDGLRDKVIDVSGNDDGKVDEEDYTESYGKRVPKGKKNKDVTTNLLVDEGKGEELKTQILDTKERLTTVYSDLLKQYGKDFGLRETEINNRIENMSNNLPLKIDDETWQKSKDKNSWADFKFRQMPVAAVLPLMSQMQADAKSSEAALVNDLAELTGGRVVEFDAFFPVVSAKKAYVIRGEPFEAEISVGTYSSQINPADITISVNGQTVPVGEDGKAAFSQSTSGSLGPKTLNLSASVKNPLTGEVIDGDATFEYEVGERSIAVSADKMNVFYIGVDNPISVSAAGIPTADLRVTGSGGGIKIRKVNNSQYMVRVANVDNNVKVNVTGGGFRDTKPFRAKRIPDPIAKLGRSKGGSIGSGEFRVQAGVLAILENFDFEAQCNVDRFEMVYIAPRQDAVLVQNKGPRFVTRAKNLVGRAKPGDTYLFRDVRAKCPGDKNTREINDMVFNIK